MRSLGHAPSSLQGTEHGPIPGASDGFMLQILEGPNLPPFPTCLPQGLPTQGTGPTEAEALLVASAPSRFPQQIPNSGNRRRRRLLTSVLQCTPHSPGALCLERILQPSGSCRRPEASPDPESTWAAELGGSGWFSEGQAGSLLSGPSPCGFGPGGCRRREPTTFLHVLWPHAV